MARDKATHAWARRDADLVVALFVLLLLAGLHVFFVYVLLAALAAFGLRLLVRAHRRRQAQRANDDAPFWADRVRDDRL